MKSAEIQKRIHEEVKSKLRVGMTEKELADVITSVCPHWEGDLLSGKRTAEIEGGPTDKVIESGDVVLLDLQVKSEGEWTDLTRVYFMGEISEKQKDAYNRVLNALKTGEELLRPGTKCRYIWEKVRKAIDSPYAFDHHAGHRIGEEQPVAEPRFVPESDDELAEGMIVTLEPAIYFPGEFGIRLENNYRILKDGYERVDKLEFIE